MVRPEGLALWLSLGVTWAALRRWKALVLLTLGYGLVAAPLFIRNLIEGGETSGYATLFARNLSDLGHSLSLFVGHSYRFLGWLFSFALSPHTVVKNFSGSLIWVCLGLFLVGVGFWSLTKGKRGNGRAFPFALLLFSICYLFIHFFWTAIDSRYFLVLLPFLFLFVVGALDFFGRSGRAGRWLSFLLIVGMGYSYARAHQGQLARNSFLAEKKLPVHTYAWVTSHTEVSNPVHCIGRRHTFWLYTSRLQPPGYPVFEEGDAYRLSLVKAGVSLVFMEGNNWLTLASLGEKPRQYMVSLLRYIQGSPELFSQVYLNAEEGAAVYRLEGTGSFVEAYSLYETALAAARDGRLSDAKQTVEKALSLGAPFPSALTLSGVLALLSKEMAPGEGRLAERRLREAIRLCPGSARARLNLGRLLKRQGKVEEARIEFEKALDVAKEDFFSNALVDPIESELNRRDSNGASPY